MVTKLLKHELVRMARIAAIPAIVMVALAVIFRISLIGYNDEGSLPYIVGLFYVISVVAMLVVCAWAGIVRFYRTLFTGEGYMTLSLHVTADQLLLSKLLSSIIALVCGAIVCTLSAFILLIAQTFDVMVIAEDVLSYFGDFFPALAAEYGGVILFEIVLWLILFVPQSFLLYYLVMALAQLFTTKNRVVIAVLIAVGGSFVWSIFSTAVLTPFTDWLYSISPHLELWAMIIFTAAVDVGCYFIVRYIIKNKVNLIT